MAQWFATGGIWMYPILALALLGGLFAGVSVILAIAGRALGGLALNIARVISAAAFLVSVLPAGLGAAGWLHGRSVVEEALAQVDPSLADELREVGYAEARVPFVFGGAVSGALLVLSFVALGVSVPPSRRPPEG